MKQPKQSIGSNYNRRSSNDRARIQLAGEDHRTLLLRLIEHLRAAGVVREVDHIPWDRQANEFTFAYIRMVSSEHVSGMIRMAQTFRDVRHLI